jgi:DNA adenine methylase
MKQLPLITSCKDNNIPFLKWPGGKRWLALTISDLIKNKKFDTYIEPFLGGGAIFFHFNPQKAILSDINQDLINTYRQVKENANRLIIELKKIKVSETTYYRLRSQSDGDDIYRAVRFLYLNRNAFGGMYRLNRNGEFNVPFGGGERNHHILWKNDLLLNASTSLKNAQIECSDFESILCEVGKRDIVFCDPTYTVSHNNNGFRRYNERNFSWEDQIRLAETVEKVAHDKKTPIIVCNANHKDIEDLYPKAKKFVFNRSSCLCPNSIKRITVSELLLIYNI